MGESKRKSRRVEAEAAVRKAMGEVSTAFEGDEPAIQFLLLAPDRAEETRRRLGGLPERVERALRSMRASSAAATGRGYVQWWSSPDGREAATIIEDLHDGLFESEVRGIALTASARGYGVRLANFHSEALAAMWERVRPQYELMLKTAWAEMKSGPPVTIERHGDAATTLLVPGPRDEREWPRLARELVRHFDRLAATRESFESSFRRVEVVFDGYDDDPREVMDIEQCRWIIRFVQAAIAHWRWFLPWPHMFAWTGAAYATSGASVDAEGRMSFSVDQEAARLGLALHLRAIVDVANDIGIDLSGQVFKERVHDSMDMSQQSLRGQSARQEPLATGRMGFAESATSNGLGSGAGGLAADVAMPPVPVILDRSLKGSVGRRLLIASQGGFPPESVKVAIDSWYGGRCELALIRRDNAAAEGWVLEEMADDEVMLEAAIERVLRSALERRESMPLLPFVGASLGGKLEGLLDKCMDRVLASPPPTSLVLTPEPAGDMLHAMRPAESATLATKSTSGLLDLAVEPGGVEVDMDRLQVTDPEEFAKVAGLDMSVVAELMVGQDETGPDLDSVERRIKESIRGWARDDGTLVIRSSGRGAQEVIIRAGCWRLLDAAEQARLSQEASKRLGGREGVKIAEALADVLQRETSARTEFAERASSAFDATTSVTGLFGRSQKSLLHLRDTWAKREDLVRMVDEWLGGPDDFFLIWRQREGGVAASIIKDEGLLMEEGLAQMLALGDSPGASMLIALTGTAIDSKAMHWWADHGGVLAPAGSRGA